jgi:nucleoid-associated protein YgaU
VEAAPSAPLQPPDNLPESDRAAWNSPERTALPNPQVVTTESGDSLWTISERVYGRGDYYKALFLHNRALIPQPDRIAAGIQLAIPSLDELRQRFPDACPRE